MEHPLISVAVLAFSRLVVAGGLIALVAVAMRRR